MAHIDLTMKHVIVGTRGADMPLELQDWHMSVDITPAGTMVSFIDRRNGIDMIVVDRDGSLTCVAGTDSTDIETIGAAAGLQDAIDKLAAYRVELRQVVP